MISQAQCDVFDKGISWVEIGSSIRIGGPAPRGAGPVDKGIRTYFCILKTTAMGAKRWKKARI